MPQTHTIFGVRIDLHVHKRLSEGRVNCVYVVDTPGVHFGGTDFSPSPFAGDPCGLAAAFELMTFLCVQPGDTDQEYFDDYTPDQLAWAESYECEVIKGAIDEAIVLHDFDGSWENYSGVDQHGRNWCTFEIDYFADQEDGVCSICGRELSAGWLCGDGGDEICGDHIYVQDQADVKWGYSWIGDRPINAE